jgi:adenosylmethionine-8-amino-7-oxononanoate aminotransferase
MYDAVYLTRTRALCERYNVHFIADEVMTGCGRTGTFFAHERAGIRPDFMCLSKGITGGYLPLSLVMTTDDVYAAFYDDRTARGFLHSHSYTGNALACRAALATLEIFERGDVLVGNAAKAQYLTQAAQEIAQHPRVKNFRTTGMIWAFDVDTDDAMFGRRFYEAALEHQVILRPIGNTIYFMPPYVIEEGQMDFLVMQTKHALEQALSAS